MKGKTFWIARVTSQIYVMSDKEIDIEFVKNNGCFKTMHQFRIGELLHYVCPIIAVGKQKQVRLVEVKGK